MILTLAITLLLLRGTEGYSIGSKWPKNNLKWRLINTLPNTNCETLLPIFEKAFKTWSDVANITFTPTNDNRADISISFVLWDIFSESLARAYFPDTELKGVIEIDENQKWNLGLNEHSLNNSISLLQVVTHEIGHTLGIYDSLDKDDIMFHTYLIDRSLKGLSYNDIVAIEQLYGRKTAQQWASVSPQYTAMVTRWIELQRQYLENRSKELQNLHETIDINGRIP